MMGGVTVSAVEPGEAPQLLAFARRVRWLLVRRAALDAGKLTALLLGVPGLAMLWLLPQWWLPLVLGALLLIAIRAMLAGAVVRARADHRLLTGLAGDDATSRASFTRLGDELATWLEVRSQSRGGAMVDWLARDVARQLPDLLPVVGQAARRPLGRWLWLLPVLLLLLLAWLLSAWLSPPWRGVLGGGFGPPPPSQGAMGEQPAPGGGGAGHRPDDPGQAPPSPPRPPTTPPPAAEPEPSPEAVPEVPAPLLDLPSQQQFLIPEFVGDGPTTRVRMHAAEVEQGAPNGATGRSGGTTEPPSVPPALRFERAAEQALRSRHVPPIEQAMVRRFFEALREAGK